MAKKTSEELNQLWSTALQDLGGIGFPMSKTHTKTGNQYEVTGVALMKGTLELMVVYRNRDGVCFVQPYNTFKEKFS